MLSLLLILVIMVIAMTEINENNYTFQQMLGVCGTSLVLPD